jgi:hypothetical protein
MHRRVVDLKPAHLVAIHFAAQAAVGVTRGAVGDQLPRLDREDEARRR